MGTSGHSTEPELSAIAKLWGQLVSPVFLKVLGQAGKEHGC